MTVNCKPKINYKLTISGGYGIINQTKEVRRMQTRERLLAFLEENKGRYLSGEQIAQALSVSRAAVWKAVQGLRSAG